MTPRHMAGGCWRRASLAGRGGRGIVPPPMILSLVVLLGCGSRTAGGGTTFTVNPEVSWAVGGGTDGVMKWALKGDVQVVGGDCPRSSCSVTIGEWFLSGVADSPENDSNAPGFELTSPSPTKLSLERGKVRVGAGQLEFLATSQRLKPPLAARFTNSGDFTLYLDVVAGELFTSFQLLTASRANSDDELSLALVASALVPGSMMAPAAALVPPSSISAASTSSVQP